MNNFLHFIKRWLILFLFIIISFNYKCLVKADTSSLSKNIIEGIYANTLLANGEEHYYYLDIYKMGTNTVYCIEPGIDITESDYYFTDNYSNLPYSSNTIEYIKKVAFFGYDYFNHQSKEYYMAAQELIWEALGNDVYWSTTFDHSGEININIYKSDIKSLIITSRNFSLTDIYLDVHNYDEYITYNDSSLFRYEIVDSTIDDVSLSNGVLTIFNNHDLDGQTITFKYKNYTNNNPLLFYNGISQKMISGGYIDFPEYVVTLHTKKGNLTINKYDGKTLSNTVSGNGSLEGALYELYDYDNNKVGDYYTDIEGKIYIDNLEYGSYYLKEISASRGYKLDDCIYNVEIIEANNKLDVYEEPIFGTLEIIKTYGEDKIFESGVVFDIYSSNNELYDSITTDNDGYASINLPYGDYSIKQRSGIDGYELIDDFMVNIDGSKDIYTFSLNDKKVEEPIKDVDYEIIINPKTGDNIYTYLIVLVVSFAFLVASIIAILKNSLCNS